MATESDAKEIYDGYYGWSSGFVHAQWGAVRDTDFITCHNPLHRLHRIPRAFPRRQASVERDAASLLNGMIDLVDLLYRGSEPIERLAYTPDTSTEAEHGTGAPRAGQTPPTAA